MAISIRWDDDERKIALYEVHDPWEWGDLHRMVDELFKMMDSVDYKVDAIASLHSKVTFKAGMLSEGRKILSRRHQNAGLTVVVDSNVLFRSVLTMLRLTYPRLHLYTRFQFAGSIEEARALIQRHRLTEKVVL